MTLFEQLKPMMDAQVDDHLGDSITYKIDGAAVESPDGAPTLNAFLLDYVDDGGGFDTAKPGTQRWQLKIRKSLLPERPSMKHLVQAAKLDGPYRPAANVPVDGGAYWIVDLQKAPA